MSKDWTGNKKTTFVTLGASNHTDHERAEYDYYATEPKAITYLLEVEKFSQTILEPACGQGHIAKALESHGYKVLAYDLIDRGYGTTGIDFLTFDKQNISADVITNPPYKLAQEFVEKAMSVIAPGHKVAMFLKLTFLETDRKSVV